MRKKLWKSLLIAVVLFVSLTMAAVAAFVFNPFEGSLPDMRELVPRDVDYFIRKTDLADDFTSFPEPKFWADLAASNSWRTLKHGAAYRDVERQYGVEAGVDQLRQAAGDVASSSAGFAGLLKDAIGEELVVAGKFQPASFCAYTRVTWKVRFLWGLLQWNSVRDQFRAQGMDLRAEDDGTLLLQPPGGKPLYLARHLDCLMISDDKALLQESLALANGQSGTESFGGSADYRDGVEGRIREWEERTEVPANAVELYLRPDEMFELTTWDDNWPDPRNPDSMNERVLASFLNLKGWRFMTGALIFEPHDVTVLARIDLNRNAHTGFQDQFFRTEAQDRSDWLDPFLSMVPERSCAAAAMRMPARDFLFAMYDAIDQDAKELFNERLRKTGKDGARALIDSLGAALEPRIGFVFFRARDLGPEITSHDPSPAPHFAWVFWVSETGRKIVKDLFDFVAANSHTIGFEKAYDMSVTGLKGGDAVREYVNPNIAGTGEIAILIYGSFFVVSNSGPLVKDMIWARQHSSSILQLPDYERFDLELSNRLNGFVFVQGPRMVEVLTDYRNELEKGEATPDAEWAVNNRPRIEQQVLRDKYRAYTSAAAIPASQRQQFDHDVELALGEGWREHRARTAVGDREALDQAIALMRTFSSAYVQMRLDPQSIQLTSRFRIDYR